jgi:hypothetical protein
MAKWALIGMLRITGSVMLIRALAGGVGVTVLDAVAGSPLFWAASEGPLTVALGVVLVALARL